jgi:predicted metal-dependent enzyme (double-stranded beta helix superfamily)
MSEENHYGPVGTTLLFENDQVRVWEVKLEPGEQLATHHHEYPYVVVAITGDETQMVWLDGHVTRNEEPPGHVVFRPAGGIHNLTNVGRVTYLNRLVELK